MTPPASPSQSDPGISTSLIDDVCSRLAGNQRIRRPLPGGGLLYMDRSLPFLCVYRCDPQRRDEDTSRLVTSEAAYLFVSDTASERNGLKRLIRRISETAVQQLGSFLILELWSGVEDVSRDAVTGEVLLPRPEFRIFTQQPEHSESTVSPLEFALQQIRVHRKSASVQVNSQAADRPPGMRPLMSAAVAARIGCHLVGIEVKPIYRDPESGEVYDRVSRAFRRQFSSALKKSFFAFALNRTQVRPEHHFSFGTSTLPKQVLTIDRQLSELSRQFKFLLLVTPINAERAWKDFSEGGFRKTPRFHYRPLDVDPMLLKRRLMRIATERVDDPTLSYVLRQTQYELDRQITMLADIGTFRFLPGSLQVFEGVKPELAKLASEILGMVSHRDRRDSDTGSLNASGFSRLAEQEIKHYRDQSPAFAAQVTTRDDLFSGLLVVGGDLLIGRETRIAKRRADALLQHEVGTHLVTYYNGASQPLRLLQVGLAGYDALQEGLAVLAEYLVGGLSEGRLRTLAARVIAADQMVAGVSFANVFQQLVDEFMFEPRTAYTITMRVFRGGGLTKDALYLRGLVEILKYLGDGGDVEPLFVGKFAAEHVPIIRELTLSGVLRPPPLRPKYLDLPEARRRLSTINPGTTVLDLIANGRTAE